MEFQTHVLTQKNSVVGMTLAENQEPTPPNLVNKNTEESEGEDQGVQTNFPFPSDNDYVSQFLKTQIQREDRLHMAR